MTDFKRISELVSVSRKYRHRKNVLADLSARPLTSAALKTKAGTIEAAVHNATQDVQVGYNQQGLFFTVSPLKFSERVIEAIEKNFPTFEGATSFDSSFPKDFGINGPFWLLVSTQAPHDTPNRSFKFEKSSQLFVRSHDETLSVVAIRVSNPDRSPVEIHG